MDVSGTVFRLFPSLIGSGMEVYSNSPASLSVSSFDGGRKNHWLSFGDNQLLGSRRRRRAAMFSINYGFSDEGHMKYYSSEPTTRAGRITCGSRKIDKAKANGKSMFKEEKKKRLKLVEGLSRDLSMFSDLGGFGLDNHGMIDQVQGKMISEATELLFGQLQKLKAKEEVLSRKRREERAKLKAAARMQKRLDREMSSTSSSSSSESSDSECGEVVDMSSLRSVTALAPPVVDELRVVIKETILQPPSTLTEESTTELQSVIREPHASLIIPSTVNQKGTSIQEEGAVGSCLQHIVQPCFTNQANTNTNCNKIEVCMGGKCKKSGAEELLEEFQRVLGAEASVVGCKCMGKCRDGPNVRILNGVGVQAECVDDPVRVPSKPLCIGVGVGFEDVGAIVANFLGEKHKECSVAASS